MDTTVWRWFPVGLLAALGIVVAVNGVMIYDAVATFPGVAGADGFDLSNEYKKVLATAQAQAALGWHINADVSAERYPVLTLAMRDGMPLTATTIEAQAERPVGPAEKTSLDFKPAGNGRYQADTSLFSGQWDLMLTVHAEGKQYSATRRVVVK